MNRRRRSTRSHVVELVLVGVVFVAIYLWLMNGGPSAFGHWFADYLGAP